jgi:hypothetical protein
MRNDFAMQFTLRNSLPELSERSAAAAAEFCKNLNEAVKNCFLLKRKPNSQVNV